MVLLWVLSVKEGTGVGWALPATCVEDFGSSLVFCSRDSPVSRTGVKSLESVGCAASSRISSRDGRWDNP